MKDTVKSVSSQTCLKQHPHCSISQISIADIWNIVSPRTLFISSKRSSTILSHHTDPANSVALYKLSPLQSIHSITFAGLFDGAKPVLFGTQLHSLTSKLYYITRHSNISCSSTCTPTFFLISYHISILRFADHLSHCTLPSSSIAGHVGYKIVPHTLFVYFMDFHKSSLQTITSVYIWHTSTPFTTSVCFRKRLIRSQIVTESADTVSA